MSHDPAVFHKLYGPRAPRATYYPKDFVDYTLMLLVSAVILGLSYGFAHPMALVGYVLSAFTLAAFIIRHGIEWRVPLVLRRPQDLLFMFLYKFRNLTLVYVIALGTLLLESFLVAATPQLPHHSEGMRTVALWLFYIHFVAITLYRTRILADHLKKKELVREVLMQTSWKRIITDKTNMNVEILHAYISGLLAHVILVAPWYLVIQYANFSILFLPAAAVINVLVHLKWLRQINAWFYRDHWLGHNSELEFLYLHGSHHDAIPSGMIAVAENGFLEGFLRLTLGTPLTFYHPILSFLVISIEVQKDMEAHQYIPGVYPRLPRKVMEVSQHSTHHYGQIEPYSFGIKVDQPSDPERYRNLFRGFPEEMKNSAKLDEELTGFKWDNPTFRRTLTLYARYNHWEEAPVSAPEAAPVA